MKPISQYITVMLASLLGIALSACGSDPESPSATSEMSISFRVETRNGGESNAGEGSGTTQSDKYAAATAWENYIDIDNKDYKNYRIAFFDFDNRCITPFEPTKIEVVEDTNYVDYILVGQVPGILTLYSNFKIVVLANWGSGNYPEIKAGVTTIEDLCCPKNDEVGLGRFQYFESSDYKIAPEQRYVPMYGVKEYKGVEFGIDNKENPTVLYKENFGPINMLRAIAKVEVVFDTPDKYELQYDIDGTNPLYITRYNATGYCAPEGCYLEGDYAHGSWSADYWQGYLHLVGGKNDEPQAERTLPMARLTIEEESSNSSDNGTDEATKADENPEKIVWVAYLPEYRNLALTSGKKDCQNVTVNAADITPARIAVPLKRGDDVYTSYIEFATYTDGEPGTAINIERNNLYRFTITRVDQGIKWIVKALPWNGYEHEEIVM